MSGLLNALQRETARLVWRHAPRTPWGDRIAARARFFLRLGYWPPARRDATYNSGLLDLMLNEGDNPLRGLVSDKLRVRDYLRARVDERYVQPLVAVLLTDGEVDGFDFPEECVVKPNHLSGPYQICTSDRRPDREEIKSWLRLNYYTRSRERNYRRIEPRILVEPLLGGVGGSGPKEFRLHCFAGRAKFIHADSGGRPRENRSWHMMDWTQVPFSILPTKGAPQPKPARLAEMTAVAETIARDFSFIRVDFIEAGEALHITELTSFANNATHRFEPDARIDFHLGALFSDPDADFRDLVAKVRGLAAEGLLTIYDEPLLPRT